MQQLFINKQIKIFVSGEGGPPLLSAISGVNMSLDFVETDALDLLGPIATCTSKSSVLLESYWRTLPNFPITEHNPPDKL